MSNSSTPLVSAVITTHRRPQPLREAIASVVAESYAAIELIIAEDGEELTSDDLGSIERPWRLVQRDVGDAAGARNLGLEYARGEYVIFLDDDDLARPTRIASLARIAVEGGYDLCYGLTLKIDPSQPNDGYLIPTYPAPNREVGFAEMLTCMPHVNAMLGRTEALRAAGGFNASTSYFDEWALWLTCLDRGARAYFCGQTVAEWRLHGGGMTGSVVRGEGLKPQILTLLRRMQSNVGDKHRLMVERAIEVAEAIEIATYDDYADAMATDRRRQ